MQVGMSVIACSFIYLIILLIAYFKKERVKGFETKLYSILLVLNLIGLFLEFSCCLTVFYQEVVPALNIIVNRLHLLYFVTYITVFTVYVWHVSFETKLKDSKINELGELQSKKGFLIVYVIFFLLVLFLPLYYFKGENAVYSYGPATDALTLLCGVYLIIDVYCLVKNFKNIKIKKNIPLFSLIFFMIVAFIIRNLNPSIILINSSFAFVTAIMYFTIENPDLKMLNDYHKAKEYAEDSNIEKQMFVYNISQDMKHPLLKMSRFCENLLYSENIEEYKNGIRSIKSECNSMIQNINSVFDIDVKDIRDLSTDNTKYNIKNLLKLIDSNVKRDIQDSDKKIEYISSINDTIPEELIGDSARLKEVLRIVFDNALKHTKEGYIEFHVSEIHKHNICRLMMTIEDSGVGISADKLEELFDIDKIDESKQNLALAKKIINILGGNLIVTSELNVGTKVNIVLDQELVENKENDIDKYDKDYIQDKKVLVLGGTEEEQVKLMRSIAEFGGVMESVDSINDVIDKLKKHNKYYTIILDGDLPHRTAPEMLEKLKEMKGFNTPVIFLTKDKSMKSSKNLAILGFSSSISRPVTEEDVLKALQKVSSK